MALFLTKDLDDPARSRIGVWQISESEAELRAMTSIPSDELEEISYIKSESLRKQKLAVRALLDAMFEDKVYLSHHDNGKPYIENNSINISITHTEKYVAVILDEDDEVGIDCESLDRDFSAVEKKALSDDEIDDLDDGLRVGRAQLARDGLRRLDMARADGCRHDEIALHAVSPPSMERIVPVMNAASGDAR